MNQRLLVVVLILAAILIKYINLLGLPLYLDEGLYIFWAKLFSESSGFAYVSMQDGKTPLFIWLISYLHNFFGDYLLTGRIISVISGAVSFICWLFIISKITKGKLTFYFALLMLIAPFAYLIERIAFVDSLLTALGSLSLTAFYIGFLRLKKNPWEIFFWAFLAGVFLGFAYLSKTAAKVLVFSEVLVGILWILQLVREKSWVKALYLGGGIVLTYLVYSQIVGFLRVGSYRFWGQILEKETQLTFSITEIFNRLIHLYDPHVYSIYLANLWLILQYLITYLGIIFVLFLAGIIWILKKDKKQIWLVAYFLIIFLAILLSGKVMASRYLYIVIPSVVCIASFGLFWIVSSRQKVIKNLLFLGLAFVILQSLQMVIDPLHALYTRDDRSYFITADLSALGLRESIEQVKNEGGGIVGVSGVWGVLEGSQTEFGSYGIETVNVDHWLTKSDLGTLGVCDKDQVKIGEICIKINLKSLQEQTGYLYLTRGDEDIDTLGKLRKITVLRQFQRPGSSNKTYLIKLL